MHPNQPQPPQPPVQPTYTPASIAAGCLALVALLAVAGCVGMAITTSSGTDEHATETAPATTSDDGELDEWTESIFELTWDDMSQTERDDLCAEVNEFGPDVAARVIDNETSDDADLDRHTIEQILTDHCA